MRMSVSITSRLAQRLEAEERRIKRAVDVGVKAAGQGAKADLSAHLAAADLGRMSRAVGMAAYASSRGRINAAAIIYMRGRAVRKAVAAMEYGATVRAKNGRFLAIPTSYNRAGGRRGGRVLFTPDQLTDSFIKRQDNGDLILFARVAAAQWRTQRGKIRDRAFVEGRLMAGGRGKQTRELLEAGVVPMFVLRSVVRIKKRLDIKSIKIKWQRKAPGLVAGLLRETGG